MLSVLFALLTFNAFAQGDAVAPAAPAAPAASTAPAADAAPVKKMKTAKKAKKAAKKAKKGEMKSEHINATESAAAPTETAPANAPTNN